MRPDVRGDFDWQMAYLGQVKQVVGPLLLEAAPLELDMHEATDLLMLTAKDMRIACRLRRPGYADSYPWEFTLRSHRDSGATTELSKIVAGWGDWLFYGHMTTQGTLGRWFVINLHAFREHLIRRSRFAFHKKSNGDGTYFIAYDVRTFPPPSVCIASSHEIPRLEVAT